MRILAPRWWLEQWGLDDRGYRHWWVEMTLDTDAGPSPTVELRVDPAEWALAIRHGRALSEIRCLGERLEVTRDDLALLDGFDDLPPLDELLERIERRFDVAFRRHCADVHSNLEDAPSVVRCWLGML